MRNLIKVDNNLTISSLEIAALTGKRHDNVTAGIIKMSEDLGDEMVWSPENEDTNTHLYEWLEI